MKKIIKKKIHFNIFFTFFTIVISIATFSFITSIQSNQTKIFASNENSSKIKPDKYHYVSEQFVLGDGKTFVYRLCQLNSCSMLDCTSDCSIFTERKDSKIELNSLPKLPKNTSKIVSYSSYNVPVGNVDKLIETVNLDDFKTGYIRNCGINKTTGLPNNCEDWIGPIDASSLRFKDGKERYRGNGALVIEKDGKPHHIEQSILNALPGMAPDKNKNMTITIMNAPNLKAIPKPIMTGQVSFLAIYPINENGAILWDNPTKPAFLPKTNPINWNPVYLQLDSSGDSFKGKQTIGYGGYVFYESYTSSGEKITENKQKIIQRVILNDNKILSRKCNVSNTDVSWQQCDRAWEDFPRSGVLGNTNETFQDYDAYTFYTNEPISYKLSDISFSCKEKQNPIISWKNGLEKQNNNYSYKIIMTDKETYSQCGDNIPESNLLLPNFVKCACATKSAVCKTVSSDLSQQEVLLNTVNPYNTLFLIMKGEEIVNFLIDKSNISCDKANPNISQAITPNTTQAITPIPTATPELSLSQIPQTTTPIPPSNLTNCEVDNFENNVIDESIWKVTKNANGEPMTMELKKRPIGDFTFDAVFKDVKNQDFKVFANAGDVKADFFNSFIGLSPYPLSSEAPEIYRFQFIVSTLCSGPSTNECNGISPDNDSKYLDAFSNSNKDFSMSIERQNRNIIFSAKNKVSVNNKKVFGNIVKKDDLRKIPDIIKDTDSFDLGVSVHNGVSRIEQIVVCTAGENPLKKEEKIVPTGLNAICMPGNRQVKLSWTPKTDNESYVIRLNKNHDKNDPCAFSINPLDYTKGNICVNDIDNIKEKIVDIDYGGGYDWSLSSYDKASGKYYGTVNGEAFLCPDKYCSSKNGSSCMPDISQAPFASPNQTPTLFPTNQPKITTIKVTPFEKTINSAEETTKAKSKKQWWEFWK